MTLIAYLHGSDEALSIRLGTVGLTSNADGGVGTGTIIFDDPDKTLTVRGWMYVKVVETECVDFPVLYTGFILDRVYSRSGPGGTYRHATGRWIACNVCDANELLAIRLITNPDGKRPKESHNARIDWYLASSYNAGPVSDLGEIDRSHPRPLDEADYRGQVGQDVMNDIAAPINKMFFVYPDATDPDPGDNSFGEYFANPNTTYGISPLRISNDLADRDEVTFFPLLDAEQERDPTGVYSLNRYKYLKGLVLEANQATYDTFFSAAATGGPNLGHRGFQTENIRIGSEDSARIMSQGLLAKAAQEADTITVTIDVPPFQVGYIQPDHSIYCKFTHLDGYEDFTLVRVSSRTIAQAVTAKGGKILYRVTLKLSNKGLPGSGGTGGGSTGPFPQQPPAALTIIQQDVGTGGVTMPNGAPADGDGLVLVTSMRSGAFDFTGLGYVDSGEGDVSQGPADYVNAGFKEASGDVDNIGATNDQALGWYEISPGATVVDHASDHGTGYTASTPSVTIPAGGIAWAAVGAGSGGGFDHGDYNGPPTRPGPNYAWQNPLGWQMDWNGKVAAGHPSTFIGYYRNSTDSPINLTPTFPFYNDGAGPWPWQAVVIVLGPGASSSPPPSPGNPVPWETPVFVPDGPNYTWRTAHPFTFGSLELLVDNTDQKGAITSYDESCGEFTVSFQLEPGMEMKVRYQAL